jgi:hypothetical protein
MLSTTTLPLQVDACHHLMTVLAVCICAHALLLLFELSVTAWHADVAFFVFSSIATLHTEHVEHFVMLLEHVQHQKS